MCFPFWPCLVVSLTLSLHCQGYNYNSDIWSFGLCLLECALGRFPYASFSVYFEMVQAIVNEPPPQPDAQIFSPAFCDFIAKCLQVRAHQVLVYVCDQFI